MKKLLAVLLLCPIASASMAADYYVTRDITLTVGVPYTINPVNDLGITPATVQRVYASNQEEMVTHNGSASYQISNASSFIIEPIQYVAYLSPYYNVDSKYYYAYTLTANNTGIYTFKQCVEYYTTYVNVTYNSEITYNITVVDVTQINIPSTLTLNLGDTYTFSPIITDSRATTTLTWYGSNTNVATINSDGELTTMGLGASTITCTAHNGVSAQCEVTVNPVSVSSVLLNIDDVELMSGQQYQLTASILPDNATDKSITWSSSNEAVAVVNESGLVTAVGAGLCNITASTLDGSGLTASCLVQVLGDVMYCADLSAVPGATVTLPIQMKNASVIQGFEFELALPEGVTVDTDENDQLKATLTDRVSTTGLDGARLENGNYKFVFTSTSRILGTEGAVVNVPLVVPENIAVGDYDMQVKNVELVKYSTSEQIHHGDRTATLTVNAMTLGDVNGDGRVSVADAIAIINYVLGRTPVSFIAKAADVNGDESISLADAVAVVDIILGRSGGSVMAASIQLMQNPE